MDQSHSDRIKNIRTHELRILVIDDNLEFRKSLSFLLKEVYGATVDSVSSAPLALEKLKNGSSYELAFVDLMMPEMNGIEACHRLRDLDPGLEIVVMSAYSDSVEWGEAQSLERASVLAKPIAAEDVVTCLNNVLSHSKRQGRGVLILDDDPSYRNLVKSALSRTEYNLYEAASVREALRQLQINRHVKVILLDLSLSGELGTKLLEQIAEDAHKYRVIVLTAHDEYLAAEQAGAFSVFSYLPKVSTSFVQSIRFNLSQAFHSLDQSPHPVSVFISYTKPDFEKVTWIHRRLKDNGFIPWIATNDVGPGDAWDEKIEMAIKQCDCFVSCLSDIAVKRLGHFQREIELVIERYDTSRKPLIIPLLLENCDMPRQFAERKIQHLVYDPFHDDWWTRLVTALRAIYLSK
jgi:CheY-like chemotaxis protein